MEHAVKGGIFGLGDKPARYMEQRIGDVERARWSPPLVPDDLDRTAS
jgi:hypothetical protein